MDSLLRPGPRLRRAYVLSAAFMLVMVAAYLSYHPQQRYIMAPIVGVGGVVLLLNPWLGLPLLVFAALVVPMTIYTGTEVTLNAATLLVPALVGLWLLDGVLHHRFRVAPTAANKPLAWFLVAGLASLLIGNALWDPAVPRSGSLIMVQLAQWAIFALSACAFWLMANMIRDESQLKLLIVCFLVLANVLAALRIMPGGYGRIARLTSGAVTRATFWPLLTAVIGGQLLFNTELSRHHRIVLTTLLVPVSIYAFFVARSIASTWIGVVAVLAVLGWLRLERGRKVVLIVAALALIAAYPLLYEFAGGEDEWTESGGSRFVLIGRVLEVSMRNPITGIGPASYRAYANVKPLQYGRALWVNPQINSHNNYVDLFAHMGLLGLALFFWFAWEVWRIGWRLVHQPLSGFLRGYVASALAILVASLVLMAFADWILPFVYNIGFYGFQASVLVWLFLGGLVAVEQISRGEAAP